jgi:hypothetical protein
MFVLARPNCGVFVALNISARWIGAWPRLAQLVVAIPLGVITFLAAARLLRIEELSLALNAFAGPLAGRLQPKAR